MLSPRACRLIGLIWVNFHRAFLIQSSGCASSAPQRQQRRQQTPRKSGVGASGGVGWLYKGSNNGRSNGKRPCSAAFWCFALIPSRNGTYVKKRTRHPVTRQPTAEPVHSRHLKKSLEARHRPGDREPRIVLPKTPRLSRGLCGMGAHEGRSKEKEPLSPPLCPVRYVMRHGCSK